MDALITSGKVSLPSALAAALRIYGPSFNPQITLKALSYFDDGNLRVLPEAMKLRLVTAAREVDLDHLLFHRRHSYTSTQKSVHGKARRARGPPGG